MNQSDILLGILELALEALVKDRVKLTDEQRARLDANFSDYQGRIARAEAAATGETEG